MTRAAEGRRASGLLWPGLAALVVFAVLVGLGTWQMQRLSWKQELIANLSQRLNTSSMALPPRPDWSRLEPARDEFRRVRFAATFRPGEQALVYTVGSSLRADISGPGYWVFQPAVVDGGIVVVNRGFIPMDRRAALRQGAGQDAGVVTVVAALRWPEPPGSFTPAAEPEKNVWYLRDHLAISAAKGWAQTGEVATFYVDQEAPVPAGGWPKPGKLMAKLPNNHLQYALTWYGLALVLVGVFVGFVVSRRRAANSPDAGRTR